ncbi:MAG: glycosyltransferase family 2 protein [Thermodesulfovibrionales bacterium]|jgi:glycosyltransferase involved in cell wall biosynthesis
MSGMTFSIVIPAHNGERYLYDTITSAVRQTRQANEIIAVDDASSDRTAEIAQLAQWGGRVKYYYNGVSTGLADAWNRAVALSSCDWVTILHQDDLLHPEYFMHIERAVLRYPQIRHFFAACNYIDAHGRVITMPPKPHSLEPALYSGKQYAHDYLQGIVTGKHIHRCPGVTTSRGLLLGECNYRIDAGQLADDDFFLRIGAFTDVVGISYPLASFRHHPDSATNRGDELSLRLARAYVFQSRYYKESNTLLDNSEVLAINRQTARFVNLLLFHALLLRKTEWIKEAFMLRREFDEMLPSFMELNSPLWARQMWRVTSPESRNNREATFYVISLNAIIKSRDFLKTVLKDEPSRDK